jgi:hypothetical protein
MGAQTVLLKNANHVAEEQRMNYGAGHKNFSVNNARRPKQKVYSTLLGPQVSVWKKMTRVETMQQANHKRMGTLLRLTPTVIMHFRYAFGSLHMRCKIVWILIGAKL